MENAEVENATPISRKTAEMLDAADPRNVARYRQEVREALSGKMKTGEMILIGRPSDISVTKVLQLSVGTLSCKEH